MQIHICLCAKKKQTLRVCRRARTRQGMHDDGLVRVMLLRETLKEHGDAEAVQDLLQHANVLMQMLLTRDVSIDLSSTGRANTHVAKVGQLVQMCSAISDDELKARVSTHLHSILSACVSSCMCSAAAKPNNSDTMSTHDKLQHVRLSLLSSFQA
jgi:hypothetical protein